ncbi:MAG: NAD(P)/FAD-dependent oxidoreductase [Hyphomicrobiales bacterium]|nr:MAG: NAD(P)/FAD-dependent oxidoreductase [Hyphomicrobiales bacterium]
MTSDTVRSGAEQWAADFESALTNGDSGKLERLFADQSYLRDNGALTWDFRQFHGRETVVSTLLAVAGDIRPSNFRISKAWPTPHVLGEGEAAVVEAFFDFDTAAGSGVALINGIPDPDSSYGFVAHALYTRLEGIAGAEVPPLHPRGAGFKPAYPGQTWTEHHAHKRAYLDRDPEVLVIGAGQAGLVAAAHLDQLGVDTLIVDRNDRVGDNWRSRYDSLLLHNPVEMNGFPYLPFPRHYPEYLPKEIVGDWLDIYARYLDLNVWSGTDFLGADYDEATGRWTVTLRQGDGTQRVLHPLHIVHATGGIGGKPSVPELPGLSSFAGKVMHSSAYTKASEYGIKKAIVVGAATSAHDIALDLHDNGIAVTMVQRSPIVVNHVDTANLAYAGYIDPTIPTELVDIRYGIGLINPLREAASQQYHQMAKAMDADLLEGLEAAGLRLGDGVNGQGWLDLFLRTGGGYYLNKGASEAIVAGGIKIQQADRIVEFVEGGALLDDGTTIEADIVILATGYQNRKAEVAEQFGPELINGGGINQIRAGSARLALLVKADLDGLIPDSYRKPAKNSNAVPAYESAVAAR